MDDFKKITGEFVAGSAVLLALMLFIVYKTI